MQTIEFSNTYQLETLFWHLFYKNGDISILYLIYCIWLSWAWKMSNWSHAKKQPKQQQKCTQVYTLAVYIQIKGIPMAEMAEWHVLQTEISRQYIMYQKYQNGFRHEALFSEHYAWLLKTVSIPYCYKVLRWPSDMVLMVPLLFSERNIPEAVWHFIYSWMYVTIYIESCHIDGSYNDFVFCCILFPLLCQYLFYGSTNINPFNTVHVQWTLPSTLLDQTKGICRGEMVKMLSSIATQT